MASRRLEAGSAPGVRGRWIDVSLHLDRHRPDSFARLNFLGGMLHGLLRHAWFDGVPTGQAVMDAGTGFRLLPPAVPVTGQPRWIDADGKLRFSVLWHGEEPQHAVAAAARLEGADWLTLDAERYRIRRVETAVAPWRLPWPGHEAGAHGEQCPLAIEWLTPVHLASRARVSSGHGDRPPYLFRILRSLERRALVLEPEWSAAWGLGTPQWAKAVEAVRRAENPVPAGAHDMMPLMWRYGSRTKIHAITRRGLIGVQRFRVPAHAAVVALLKAGEALGAGEGSTFGCGRFVARFGSEG